MRAALDGQRPDVVLIEGPPEADDLVALAADPDMVPPVALLGYVPGEPRQAAFWPFAVFSPEWQAITYALEAGVPVRFCDLPAAHQLARKAAGEEQPEPRRRTDPVSDLAAAAGYDDPERWWEDVVEHGPGPAVFDALAEAMAVLRADAEDAVHGTRPRGAHAPGAAPAAREGFERIAVICGAWHVPALRQMPSAAADDRLLRGLPKVKAALTWVPWTHGRLAYASGYGAGIPSPGWYHHLFSAPDQPIERWLTRVAAVLRADDLPVSSAHVIEAVRLAEALAALRGRPLAGLAEVTEAAQAVLCDGADLLVALIQRQLVVGERLGAVPPATPMVPLQRDLTDAAPPEAPARGGARDYDLDLRKPNDLARCRLLHRLALLDVPWGRTQQGRPGTRDVPGDLAADLAARARPGADRGERVGHHGRGGRRPAARSIAADAAALDALTALTEQCLLADLGDALPGAGGARDRAALDTDVTHLMAALPALVRAARYGDVRGTDPARLGDVVDELVTRICAGLPAAVASLDDTAERACGSASTRCTRRPGCSPTRRAGSAGWTRWAAWSRAAPR